MAARSSRYWSLSVIHELKADVKVRRDDGTFMLVPKGRFVNYSSSRSGDTWTHRFSVQDRRTGKFHEYICTETDGHGGRPAWL